MGFVHRTNPVLLSQYGDPGDNMQQINGCMRTGDDRLVDYRQYLQSNQFEFQVISRY